MENNYKKILPTFLVGSIIILLILFIGSGVNAQVNQNQDIQEAIIKGFIYMEDQNWGSEILIFHLLDNKFPQYNTRLGINKRYPNILQFDYPVRQYVSNQPIIRSQIKQQTLSVNYYNYFIDIFDCNPLTIKRINEVFSLTDDTEEDVGPYKSAHSLLFLTLMNKDYGLNGKCGSSRLVRNVRDKIPLKINELNSQLDNNIIFDYWIEKVAVLSANDVPISSRNIQKILDEQQPNGGWRPAEYYDVNNTFTHTSALAIWALVEELN